LSLLFYSVAGNPAAEPGSAMVKKTRKKSAAKAAKKAKASSKTKGAKKKAAPAKSRRKVAARKKSKPAANKKPAGKKVHKSLLKEIEDKVSGAFHAIVDTFTDADRLHHQLDPGVSKEPE
jgi:hypothetical protein